MQAAGVAITGAAFGFCLSRIGFSSWDEVYAMFRFENLRLLLTFASAVALLFAAWIAVARLSATPPKWIPRRIHQGTIAGGIAFGVGWALTGACPGIVLVQLGEGQLAAGITLLGLFGGNWLYSLVHERYFHWTTTSCIDE